MKRSLVRVRGRTLSRRVVVAAFVAVSSHICRFLEHLAPATGKGSAEDTAVASLHGLPMMVFFSIAAHTTMQAVMEVRQDARDIASPVSAVTTIAGLFYLCGYMQRLTLTASVFPGGKGEYPLRYLMWAFTTPCFIFSAGHSSKWQSSSVRFFMSSDILMIVSGYMATLATLDANVRIVAEMVSCVCFVITVVGWVGMVRSSHAKAVEALEKIFKKDGADEQEGSIEGSGDATQYLRGMGLLRKKGYVAMVEIVSWVGFPLVWYLCKYGKIDDFTEEALYVALDLLSKGVYAICECAISASMNHVIWENSLVEEMVEKAVEKSMKLSTKLPRDSSTPSLELNTSVRGAELFEQFMNERERRPSSPGFDRLPCTPGRVSSESLSSRHSSLQSIHKHELSVLLSQASMGQDDDSINAWLRERTNIPDGGGLKDRFIPKDLSKMPGNFQVNGTLEILLIDSDMSEAVKIMDDVSSLGATVTLCKDPLAVLDLFGSNSGPRRSASMAELARAGSDSPRERDSPRTKRKTRPDVVLMGYDPEWGDDWLTLLRWLIKSFKGELSVIMLVTPEMHMNADKDETLSDALKNGASDFMVRPIHRLQIKTRVQNILEISNGKRIKKERDDFQNLLHRMIPQRVMGQLLSGQGVIADSHADVTVLFADIVNFTTLASNIPTSEIILILNELFSEFDRAVDIADVYKVETIGDCYMCAAGFDGDGNHAERMVDMAMRMIDAVNAFKSSHDIRIRIGIHTGNVFTGVVGTKCPRWCLYGDTVNTASRMESTSFPMCIQLSDSTRESLDSDGSYVESVRLSDRVIKGKGVLSTHLVKYGEYQAALSELSRTSLSSTSTESLENKQS